MVTLPLKAAFTTSSHAKSELTHIIVRVVDEDGVTGYGEVACETAPFYGPETATTCWHVLREFLAPTVLHVDLDDPRDLAGLLGRFRGNRFAKAGLDMGVWDLFAKARGISLARALGGTNREVQSGVSLGIGTTVEATVESARRVAAAGHCRVKLKVRPGMAEPVVRAVREALGDSPIQLAIDANGSFAASDLGELTRLDGYGLAMIEQPFGADEWLLHRELALRIATPICLDESIETLGDAELALDIDACGILNIKISRLGGLTPALAVHDFCHAAGVPVWCGGMHEFGIGRAANVALASLPAFTLPGDLSGSAERYERDIVAPPIVSNAGRIVVPDGLGIGHVIDERLLEVLAVDTADIGLPTQHARRRAR